ncbi:ribonuclease H-like domain, reverse transcriptase, RNA-dependent DNA polymerase [Tanacetum coccineum]
MQDVKNVEEHEEPKKVIYALKDPSWIEAMQEELLQFKLQKVWTLVDLPNGKRAIGSKWVFRNKKDERGIMIRNKARLVAQGYTQEEGIDYDEIEEEVYVFNHHDLKIQTFPDRVYKVEKAFVCGLHQAPRAWSMIGSLIYLTSSRPDIMFAVCVCARYQVNPKVSHHHAVKRIFRYLKGQPKLGLWYPKDSLFDLIAYTDSDYTRASAWIEIYIEVVIP